VRPDIRHHTVKEAARLAQESIDAGGEHNGLRAHQPDAIDRGVKP